LSLIRTGAGLHRAGEQRWRTIRYALDDTGRTIRLCAILLAAALASVLPLLVVALLQLYLSRYR
jgi:hypothetical protein